MATIPKVDFEKILERWRERRAQIDACPFCGHAFALCGDGYFANRLASDSSELVIGTFRGIPTVVLICSNCGYLCQFSLVALGLADLFQRPSAPSAASADRLPKS